MANYQLLKADIDAKVYQNGKQEITGENLNSILNTMVASLGAGYQFMGMATPTNPGTAQTPDYKCFYLATTPGTYTNLGGLVVADGEVAILKYDSSWHKEVTGAATVEQLNQLGQKLCPGGVNLFNYEKREKSKYLNTNNGDILDLAGYYISDYIYVKGLTVVRFSGLSMSNNGGWELFDENKTRISYGANARNGITIGNAVYLRVCGSDYFYKQDMVCSGNLPAVYVPFTNIDKFSLYDIDNENFLMQTNPPIVESLTILPTTYTPGIFNSSLSGYSTSDYISVSFNLKKYYLYFLQTSGDVPKVQFYDKDKNQIGEITWSTVNSYVGKIMEIHLPKGCEYVRFAKFNGSAYDGIYTCDIENPQDVIAKALGGYYTENNNLLWVGTSIPEGATYPLVASKACGYNCINNSKGSQSLAIRTGNSLCMMYTQQEFYDNFHSLIGTDLTQAEYNSRIDKTFERNVLPFVRGESLTINDGDGDRTINPNALKVSALIVDHNYNDYVNIATLLADENNIDWASRDRTNFVGAMNYLMDEVRKVNPTLKIVLAGYFQNSWLVGGTSDVCKMQSLCAEHFNLEIIETWKYSQINNKIIKGTSGYMAWFNSTYNKSYVVPASAQDAQGNITAQYIYLPDGIHPHSDLTQHCNERLNAIYTKFLKSII